MICMTTQKIHKAVWHFIFNEVLIRTEVKGFNVKASCSEKLI